MDDYKRQSAMSLQWEPSIEKSNYSGMSLCVYFIFKTDLLVWWQVDEKIEIKMGFKLFNHSTI